MLPAILSDYEAHSQTLKCKTVRSPMNLASKPCRACRKGAPVVTSAETEKLMPQLDAAWRIVEVGGVPRLVRVFSVKNFVQAMDLAQCIGELAESEGHHPALLVE